MNIPVLLARAKSADLYRELGPSLWYLDGTDVWEDMQRFKLFGEFS